MTVKKKRPFDIWILTACAVICSLYAIAYKGYGMFTPEKEPILQGFDDSFYYFWLRSTVIDRDVDFFNELEMANTIDSVTKEFVLNGSRTSTGLLPNKYPVGWAIANLPSFLLAHIISLIAGLPATGFEPIYFIYIWIGQLIYTVIGLFLSVKIISRFVPINTAWLGMLFVWLSSPLLYYQTARVSLSHNTVYFLTLTIFYLTFKIIDNTQNWRAWFGLGFFSGFLIITRSTAVTYLIFPALVIIKYLFSDSPGSQKWKRLALFIIPSLAMVFVQLLAWKLLYGTWIIYTYEGESFDFLHPQIGPILFSHFHGLLNWHPLLSVGLIVFILYTFTKKSIPKSWIISFIAIVYINASWHSWWFGSSFGHRAFESSIFFAMLGYALLLDKYEKNWFITQSLYLVANLACVWNLILLSLYFTQLIARDSPVSYSERWEAVLKLLGIGG
jgi:hypothetical protein